MTNGFKKLCNFGGNIALQDWLAQRLTAGLMAAFTLIVLLQVLLSKGAMGYDKWAGIFATQPMKVLTFVIIFSLAWHVLLGMKEIYRDYVKPVALRLAFKLFTAVWLAGCSGWAIQVLWRL